MLYQNMSLYETYHMPYVKYGTYVAVWQMVITTNAFLQGMSVFDLITCSKN